MSDSPPPRSFRFRVYRDPHASAGPMGLRGVTTLELDGASEAPTHRTMTACPNVSFYELRVPWLVQHMNLDESAAQTYARREQALRVLHATHEVLACEYTLEDMQRVLRHLGADDAALRALLTQYITAEEARRRSPRYTEISGVFAPYVPPGIDIDIEELKLECEPYVPPATDRPVR